MRAYLVNRRGRDEFQICRADSVEDAIEAYSDDHPSAKPAELTVDPTTNVKVTVELIIAVASEPATAAADAGDVVDNLLESGTLQDAINAHEPTDDDPDAMFHVLSAVTALSERLSDEGEPTSAGAVVPADTTLEVPVTLLAQVRELVVSLGDYTANVDRRTGIDRCAVLLALSHITHPRKDLSE